MRVLITGGAGFIGSHTADALLSAGYAVRVLDSLEPPVHSQRVKPKYLDSRIEFILGDVRDRRTLLNALEGCDAVFHFAAFQDYLPEYSRFFDVNVTSTALLYEVIQQHRLPIKKVIVASSQATLGEGRYQDANGQFVLPGLRPAEQLACGTWDVQPPAGYVGPLQWVETPETVSNPQTPYGMSKIAEENIALHIGKRCGIPSVAMRYSIVQGERQSFYNVYSGACRVFNLCCYLEREMLIYEDGKQVRDYINVHDVVNANMLVLHDARADFQMFNVGGGHAITVSELARAVADAYERPFVARPGKLYRFGDIRHNVSDISKLQALGWRPTHSIYDSATAYCRWVREGAPTSDILDHGNALLRALEVVRTIDAT